MRAHPALLKTTGPAPLEHTYVASLGDVLARQREIEKWSELHADEKTPAPKPLTVGETFTQTQTLPERESFWTQGIKTMPDGARVGQGGLNLELVLLDRVGWDLSRNPYAGNESLRLLIRTLFPLLVMILVCRLTPADPKALLDRFYALLRTPVQPDRIADEQAVAAARSNPQGTEHARLLPGSDWKFYRWNRHNLWGFVLSTRSIVVILGLMRILVSWGAP